MKREPTPRYRTAATVLAFLTTGLGVAAQEVETEAKPCAPIAGVEQLLVAGSVVLVGELHGTRESPAFVAEVTCAARAASLPVTVGLELPESEGERIGAFLDSPGEVSDRERLLAGGMWQADYQDGRTSAAMLDLLDALRALRQASGEVSVVLFDRRGQSGQERDRLMAAALAELAAGRGDELLVVLTGNVHAKLTPGTRWDADYEPMGFYLARQLGDRRLVALDVAHDGGSAWICQGGTAASCGAVEGLRARGGGGSSELRMGAPLEESGYHGRYAVGTIHASPPAALRD